jgi:hypothetical protein
MSVHELSRILSRKPSSLKQENAIKLAAYLVSAASDSLDGIHDLREATLTSITDKLVEVVGEVKIMSEDIEAKTKESISKKVQKRMKEITSAIREAEVESGSINQEGIDKMNQKAALRLTEDEQEYLILVLYKKSKNLKKLPSAELIKLLTDLAKNKAEDIEEEIKGIGENKVDENELENLQKEMVKSDSSKKDKESPEQDKDNKSSESSKPKESKSSSKKKKDENELKIADFKELEKMSEDQIIEITQKFFSAIA